MSANPLLLTRNGFRRGPLSRPVDRVEAWTRLALFLVFLILASPAAWAVGTAVDRAGVQQEHLQSSERYQVQARLLAPVPESASGAGALVIRAPANASWTTPAGRVRTGIIRATPGARAGSVQTIWTNAAGAPVLPPRSHDDTVASAFAAACLTTVLIAGGIGGIGGLLHRRFDRRRFAQWEDEWRRVSSGWSRLA